MEDIIEDEETTKYKPIVICDVCNKRYVNPYFFSEPFYPVNPQEYGCCSIECWIEHDNFVDELNSCYWQEVEFLNFEAEEQMKEWGWLDENESVD